MKPRPDNEFAAFAVSTGRMRNMISAYKPPTVGSGSLTSCLIAPKPSRCGLYRSNSAFKASPSPRWRGETRNYLLCMAEREGFEPPVGCPTTVFKCAAAKLFVFLCQALTCLIL